MKKHGVILFSIVLILGLPLVAAAQQVDKVNPSAIVFVSGDWQPDTPVVEDFNDWLDPDDPDAENPDADFARVYDQGNVTLAFDLTNLPEGPFTSIKVKFRAGSDEISYLHVVTRISGSEYVWYPTVYGSFANYEEDWTGLNKTKEELAGFEVKIAITDTYYERMDISAIQVEFVSEVVAPPEEPEVTEPIPVNIDYRPYRSSNSLNYRSRGKVHVVIFGSADLDVSQIDRESVLLAGVAPVRDRIRRVYSRTDRARDEYHDLVLTFKTQQLIKALEISREQELENGDEVVLNLTGNLKDDGNLKLTGNLKDDGAIPIEGEDTAVVFGKRDKNKKKGKSKNHWKWWR